MSNKQETIADIVAEMRSKAEHFEKASDLMVSESALALFLYPLIYRIEAAWKRECGNVAAMREAVDYLCEKLAELDATFDPSEVDCLRAALFAPATERKGESDGK